MKLNGTIYHLEQPVILLDLLNEYGFQNTADCSRNERRYYSKSNV